MEAWSSNVWNARASCTLRAASAQAVLARSWTLNSGALAVAAVTRAAMKVLRFQISNKTHWTA